MLMVNVAVPELSAVGAMYLPPEALGSDEMAMGDTRVADSASIAK